MAEETHVTGALVAGESPPGADTPAAAPMFIFAQLF